MAEYETAEVYEILWLLSDD